MKRRDKRRKSQVAFMWHLYGNDYTLKEIAGIYRVNRRAVEEALMSRLKRYGYGINA